MFIKGKEYLRDALLYFVGSKQGQTGIIWGSKEKGCVIITSGGRHSKRAGYEDKLNADGSWDYFGQGEIGNHDLNKFSNKLLLNKQHSVLLFTTREPSTKEARKNMNWKKVYTFQGVFEVLSYEIVIPVEGKRKGDKLIKFLLIPADNVIEGDSHLIEIINQSQLGLKNLKAKVIQAAKDTITTNITIQEYRNRSLLTKSYAISRSNGICELCDKAAPFISKSNMPFLEVHHILRLADDGPDMPDNVAAICPNCHKEAHFGLRRNEIKSKLIEVIKTKESQI